FLSSGHVTDDTDHRDAVEQRLADASQSVGDPRSGYEANHAGMTGAARVAVGHARGGVFVRHQEIAETSRLHLVPQFVLLSARDPVDARYPFGQQGLDEGLRSGKVAGDFARAPAVQ